MEGLPHQQDVENVGHDIAFHKTKGDRPPLLTFIFACLRIFIRTRTKVWTERYASFPHVVYLDGEKRWKGKEVKLKKKKVFIHSNLKSFISG